MEFIKGILKESYKQKLRSIITFTFAFLFIFEMWILELLSIKDLFAFIIVVITVLAYIVLKKTLLSIMQTKFDFDKTKMFKEIKKNGYLNEFRNTIDLEINSSKTIKYYDNIKKIGLIITETWFILISSQKPKVRKTTDIHKISEHVNTSSRIYCSIQFKDNSYINEYIEYDEIKEKLKEKYPNIYLDEWNKEYVNKSV